MSASLVTHAYLAEGQARQAHLNCQRAAEMWRFEHTTSLTPPSPSSQYCLLRTDLLCATRQLYVSTYEAGQHKNLGPRRITQGMGSGGGGLRGTFSPLRQHAGCIIIANTHLVVYPIACTPYSAYKYVLVLVSAMAVAARGIQDPPVPVRMYFCRYGALVDGGGEPAQHFLGNFASMPHTARPTKWPRRNQ